MKLFNEKYTATTFDHRNYVGNGLRTKHMSHGFFITKTSSRLVFVDALANQLASAGVISKEALQAADKEAYDAIWTGNLMEDNTEEGIVRSLNENRLRHFGAEVFRCLWQVRNPEAVPHTFTGICQEKEYAEILGKQRIFVFLSDVEYVPDFVGDVKKLLSSGREIFILAAGEADPFYPGETDYRNYLSGLTEEEMGAVHFLSGEGMLGCMDFSKFKDAEVADAKNTGILCYGDDALLALHDLSVDAVCKLTPGWFNTKGETNLWTNALPCIVFVPADFTIVPYIPAVVPTRATYYHFAELSKKYGREIYTKTPDELEKLAPGALINVYDDHLPMRERTDITPEDPVFTEARGDFRRARELYLNRKMNTLRGIRPIHAYLNRDTLEETEIDWNVTENRPAMLIDGVVISAENEITVFPGGGASVSPRKYFFDRTEKGRAVISNFSFFYTGALQFAYNRTMEDRPEEKLRGNMGYIDYLREEREGGRYETIPLYNKACLAREASGKYRAFRLSCPGGSVTISGKKILKDSEKTIEISWREEDINSADLRKEVILYTPMITRDIEVERPREYRLTVGEGRLNFAIINDKLIAARDGDLSIPPIGAVLSVSGKLREELLQKMVKSNDRGYFPVMPTEEEGEAGYPKVRVSLNTPKGFDKETWESFQWIYGGGIVIADETEEMSTDEKCIEMLRKEGWISPLSQRTQESAMHSIVRHPRTAIGTTTADELVILVISGRTPVSGGATPVEVCKAAKKLVPNLKMLTLWDGGGSSVLGLLEDNVFSEVSVPAPSDHSLSGAVRPINSMILVKEA